VWWLASKDGRELVGEQLGLLHQNLLGPMGAARTPDGVEDAVALYLEARSRFHVHVDPALGEEVTKGLRAAGYSLS
jgi:hypothetical protein